MNKKSIFTILGSILDSDLSDARWDTWRPTIALTKLDSFPSDTLEIIYLKQDDHIARQVKRDIEDTSPCKANLHCVDIKNPWNFVEVYSALFDLANDFQFSSDTDYYVHLSTGTHTMQICLFLLTETRYFPARLLQTKPPTDHSQISSESHTEIDLNLAQYKAIAQRFEKQTNTHLSYLKSGINTLNKAYNELIEHIENVALNSSSPLLLTGATGAGKTQLAKRIYALKKNQHQLTGAFIEVNCSTLSRDTASSTLFGHKKGAFTGAQSARAGLLKAADQGLLFLDEIGELGLDEQTLLLKAIEEKQFMPLGADNYERSDFQLIAGTNRDLWKEVKENRFREDLLARINIWTFELPKLKDRAEDIKPNIEYELEKYAEKNKRKISFSPEALEKFIAFSLSPHATWNANFRDLNAAVERMATLSTKGIINPANVSMESERLMKGWNKLNHNIETGTYSNIPSHLIDEVDHFDLPQLNEVIAVCRKAKNLSDAGRILFDKSRQRRKSSNDADRLRKYLDKYGLSFETIQE